MPILILDANPAAAGASRPVRPHAGQGQAHPWAEHLDLNPLDEGAAEALVAALARPGPPRLIAWSGSLGDTLFEPHPRTWGANGWRRFEMLCDALAPRLETSGRTLLFRPHASQVLSDVPSCLRFLNQREGHPFGLLLDAAGLLTPAMLPQAEDYLLRVYQSLGAHRGLHAAVLGNLARPDAGAEWLAPCPLRVGLLPPRLLIDLTRQHLSPHTPIVLEAADAADLDAQLALLSHAVPPLRG